MSTITQLTEIADILYSMEERLPPVSEEIKETIVDRLILRLQEIIEFSCWYSNLSEDERCEFEIILGNTIYRNVLIDITVNGDKTKEQLIVETVEEHKLSNDDTEHYENMGVLNLNLDMAISEDLIEDISEMMVEDVINELRKEFNPFESFLLSISEETLTTIYHEIIHVAYSSFGEHLDISDNYMMAIMYLSAGTV